MPIGSDYGWRVNMVVMRDAFLKGDVYIDYAYEDAKFRFEKDTRKVYRRFYGEPEIEILPSSKLYHDAWMTGEQITREDYFRN